MSNRTKRNIIIFSVGAALLIGLLVYYYTKVYTPPINWAESYSEEQKDPYGTFILYQLLNKLSDGEEIKKIDNPLSQFLKRQTYKGHANYVFVGDMLYLDKEDADSLVAFAAKGNDVFIASNSFPYDLNKHLFKPNTTSVSNYEEESYDEASAVDTTVEIHEEYPTDTATSYTAPAQEEPYNEELESLKADIDSSTIPETTETKTYSETTEETVTYSEDTSTYYNEETTVDSTYPWSDTAITYFEANQHLKDSIVHFQFTHPSFNPSKTYSFQYTINFKPEEFNWTYLNNFLEPKEGISRNTLGNVNKENPAFCRFNVGKGHIYYHSLPLTMTNYFLKQRINLEYANKVFSHLKPGKIYWDDYHKTYRDSNSDGTAPKSPLKYILSQPALAWAWYTSLAGVFIYMLFFAKRKQRIIPLHTPIVNTTVEFVHTLSLMFRKSNAYHIALIKAKNLRIFIWERYKIPSDLPLEDYIKQVAAFSGVEEQKVSKIFSGLEYLKRSGIDNQALAEYHHSIEYFHKNCK